MLVTHALAGQILPDARIAVRVGTPATYLDRLLGIGVARLPFGTRDQHRLILHGGGGTFFDFADHGPLERGLNAVLFAAGTAAFIKFDYLLRKLVGRQHLSARTRLGFGLGIGTFTPGSARLREALPVLADFDALWVRDAESVANLSRVAVTPPVILGSDLAFLWDYWCPPSLVLAPRIDRPGRPRVGVVLRDWPAGSGAAFAQGFLPLLDHLSGGYELTLISLDPYTDAGTLAALSQYQQVKWQPEQISMLEFAEKLSSQDVLLTSRAHGAICGACLGRASVIVGIEPKLEAVHAMLPGATRLVCLPYDPLGVAALIEEALAITTDSIAADVHRNRAEAQRALDDVLQRVNP